MAQQPQQPDDVSYSEHEEPDTNPMQPSDAPVGVKRLHVTNLPFRTNETDLSDMFGKYGELIETEVIYNERGSKGFGFVTMAQAADAMLARKNLNGTVIDGRKIEVNNATPRPKKGPMSSTRGPYHGNRGMRGGRRGRGGDGGSPYQNQSSYYPYGLNQGYDMSRNVDPYRSYGQGAVPSAYGGGYGAGSGGSSTYGGTHMGYTGASGGGYDYGGDVGGYSSGTPGYANDNYHGQAPQTSSYTQGYRYQPY